MGTGIHSDGTPSIEETGETFLANAILKAEHYSQFTATSRSPMTPVLCVAALGGRPGVHSARYAPDPPSRIKKILAEMQSVPEGQRDASFYCALALSQDREGHLDRSGRRPWRHCAKAIRHIGFRLRSRVPAAGIELHHGAI